jgi:hypothetical protein
MVDSMAARATEHAFARSACKHLAINMRRGLIWYRPVKTTRRTWGTRAHLQNFSGVALAQP